MDIGLLIITHYAFYLSSAYFVTRKGQDEWEHCGFSALFPSFTGVCCRRGCFRWLNQLEKKIQHFKRLKLFLIVGPVEYKLFLQEKLRTDEILFLSNFNLIPGKALTEVLMGQFIRRSYSSVLVLWVEEGEKAGGFRSFVQRIQWHVVTSPHWAELQMNNSSFGARGKQTRGQ